MAEKETSTTTTPPPTTTPTPPKTSTPQEKLVSTAKRLERLLGGKTKQNGSTSTTPSTSSVKKNVVEAATTMIHSNPSKIVKRWLATSSGLSGSITLPDISLTAQTLLDETVAGRAILLELSPPSSPSPPSDDETMQTEEKEKDQYLIAAARELEAYLFSLAIRILWSQSKYDTAFSLSVQAISITSQHIENSESTLTGLYPLLARLYRYQGLITESLPNATSILLESGMRSQLVHAHRMAVMRQDVDTQATLLNLMLRELLKSDQVEQAQKLLSNSTFPTSNASNNQLCRYLYYSGRIQALRLEYTLSFSNLSQCLRKTPTNTGLGFRIAVQRLLIVVQLLMGEIPDRGVFYTKDMMVELNPYLKITQAVRRGDLAVFTETVGTFTDRLKEDGTYTLISRLAHSVVKAGLRRLNTSYSRISLQDIADRLGLANATSAEFVVSKAVRDGVIDATIYHDEGYVQSHDLVDVYATVEPMEAFHRRIAYCLTTHNDAVRGMRYPPDEYKKQLEASRGLRGKKDEDKTDEEKAQELEDELDSDY